MLRIRTKGNHLKSSLPRLFKEHYANAFKTHGATAQGVDWKSSEIALQRHEFFLNLFKEANSTSTLLDIGCGYGAFLNVIRASGLSLNYTGLDLVPEMIQSASALHPGERFQTENFLELPLENNQYDYIVANGLFTQKLTATDSEMNDFFLQTISKMFAHCHRGIAFNLVTDQVDFKNPGNFYRPPAQTLNDVFKLSRHISLDHTSRFFEYFVYVYK